MYLRYRLETAPLPNVVKRDTRILSSKYDKAVSLLVLSRQTRTVPFDRFHDILDIISGIQTDSLLSKALDTMIK